MKSGLPRIAWVLAGLLALSVALLVLGNREGRTNPDSNSYDPSGVRALRSLAERLGYRTRSANLILGTPRTDEVIVAFFVESTIDPEDRSWQTRTRTNQTLSRHLQSGGSVLFVTLPRDFRSASKTALAAPTELSGQAGKLIGSVTETGTAGYSRSSSTFTLISDSTSAVVWVAKVGKGRAVYAEGLIGLTNRFIDRHDNGAIAAACLSAAAGEKRKLVFFEATHNGAGDPSVIEMLGPWAVGAWWQLNLVFVLLVLTLGVRFGLPRTVRQSQGGTRDLADALADTMARSNKYMPAFRAVVKEADRLVRKRLKIAADVPTEVRDRMLPGPLAELLPTAERAASVRPPRDEALAIARRLDVEVRRYVGDVNRRPAGRRRRI